MRNTSQRRLTLLACLDDLNAVRTAYPAALEGVILAHDPDVHIALRAEGVAHITPWDLFNADDYATVRDYLQRVLAAWDAFGRIPYGGLDLLRMAWYRHVSALSRMAWATCVIRRCLERIPASEVCVFDDETGHALDQPVEHRQMPVFHGLARGIAEQAGICVRALARGPSNRFHDSCAARAVKPQVRTGKDNWAVHIEPRLAWTIGASSHNPLAATTMTSPCSYPQSGESEFEFSRDDPGRAIPGGAADWPLKGDYILFHANGSDLKRQDRLIESLRKDGRYEVAQLYRYADATTIESVLQAGRRLWCESHFLEILERPAPFDFDPSQAHARFRSEAALLPPDLKSIFCNPRAAFHFDFLFGEYAHKLRRHVDVWQAFFRRSRPALLVANYHAPIVDVAVACGVPTLVLTHGLMLFGDTSWYTSLPACSIGAISRTHADRLAQCAIPAARLHVTGDPGVSEMMAEARESRTCADSSRDGSTLRMRLRVPADGRLVLLVTSDLGSPAKLTRLPMTNFNEAVDAIELMSGIIERNPDWRFVLRPHPRYDHPGAYDRLIQTLSDERRPHLVGGETKLGELMLAVDVIVVMNVMTSAMMELSMWGKPVVLLASAMPWYDAEQWGTRDWRHAASIAELEAMLSRMLRTADGRRDGESQTMRGLKSFFSGEPCDPIEATKEVIWTIARDGHPTGPVKESAHAHG